MSKEKVCDNDPRNVVKNAIVVSDKRHLPPNLSRFGQKLSKRACPLLL